MTATPVAGITRPGESLRITWGAGLERERSYRRIQLGPGLTGTGLRHGSATRLFRPRRYPRGHQQTGHRLSGLCPRVHILDLNRHKTRLFQSSPDVRRAVPVAAMRLQLKVAESRVRWNFLNGKAKKSTRIQDPAGSAQDFLEFTEIDQRVGAGDRVKAAVGSLEIAREFCLQ